MTQEPGAVRSSGTVWRRAATVALMVQFLALVRTLAEVFRLKYFGPQALTLEHTELYVAGGLIAALGCWIGVVCYIWRRYVAVVVVGVLTIGALIVFKLEVFH